MWSRTIHAVSRNQAKSSLKQINLASSCLNGEYKVSWYFVVSRTEVVYTTTPDWTEIETYWARDTVWLPFLLFATMITIGDISEWLIVYSWSINI